MREMFFQASCSGTSSILKAVFAVLFSKEYDINSKLLNIVTAILQIFVHKCDIWNCTFVQLFHSLEEIILCGLKRWDQNYIWIQVFGQIAKKIGPGALMNYIHFCFIGLVFAWICDFTVHLCIFPLLSSTERTDHQTVVYKLFEAATWSMLSMFNIFYHYIFYCLYSLFHTESRVISLLCSNAVNSNEFLCHLHTLTPWASSLNRDTEKESEQEKERQ